MPPFRTGVFKQSCSSLAPPFALSCRFWLAGSLLRVVTLLSAGLRCARGMQVTSTSPQTLHGPEGESVTLGCLYTPSPFHAGEVDVEWSVVNPDATKQDQVLISFNGGTEHIHGHHLAEGLSFTAGDPSTGDASLAIAQLSPAHSATYQCKVKKSPGVDMHKVTLVVMAKPSVPTCWVEGAELLGEPVSLRCESAKGSTPLKYWWRREGAAPIPAAAAQNGATGELKIGNHSQSFAGIYVCEVTNAVGAERCRVSLKANKPANRAAVIVGTAVGSLLLIFILLVFLGLFYWKLSVGCRYEKELSNEISEDSPPPESRPLSRRAARPRVTSCQVGGADVGSIGDERERPTCSSNTTWSESQGQRPVCDDVVHVIYAENSPKVMMPESGCSFNL